MSFEVTGVTHKRLVLIKQMYLHALTQASTSVGPMTRIMAVVGFDLANETMLKAIVSASDSGRQFDTSGFQSVYDSAAGVFATLNEPFSSAANIRYVHMIRNDAQHKVKYPDPDQVSDCRTYTRDFLKMASQVVWNLDFEHLSLIDLVRNTKVKEHLAKAKAAFDEQNYVETLKHSQLAFGHGTSPAIYELMAYRNRADAFGFGWASDDAAKKVEKRLMRLIAPLQTAVVLSSLGVDLVGQKQFSDTVWSVFNGFVETADGRVQVNLTGRKPTKEQADFALTYVTDAIIRIENSVGDSANPFKAIPEDETDKMGS